LMRLSIITFQKNIMSLFKMTLCRMAEWLSAPLQNETLQNVKMSFCEMSEWHFTNDALQDDRMTLCRQTQSKLERCACYNSTWQILNTFFVLLCRVLLFWMPWHQTTAPSCSLTRLHRSRNLYNSVTPYLYNVLGGFKWKAGKFEKGPQESFLFSKVFLMGKPEKDSQWGNFGFFKCFKTFSA
jgi:hypothetical protein